MTAVKRPMTSPTPFFLNPVASILLPMHMDLFDY
jgi:hypothetical protein